MEKVLWSTAMRQALYGPDGFYTTELPTSHFRTSAQFPLFCGLVAEFVRRVDAALGHPEVFAVVDVGAGGGELLTGLLDSTDLAGRLRPVAVELRPRPDGLDERIAWRADHPAEVVGMVLACEWLDNVPCDIAEADDDGQVRYQLVDPGSGETGTGGLLSAEDSRWLTRWWPLTEPGERAELGEPRDLAWAGLVASLRRGVALAIDYGHTRDRRPPLGTVTGFLDGRQVPPVPDGSRDITAHVAMDSLGPGLLRTQRAALRELGVSAGRPPIELAASDPNSYLRALSRAGEAASLVDPAGLGGHWWLSRGVGVNAPELAG